MSHPKIPNEASVPTTGIDLLNRACESCRKSKTRCLPVESQVSDKCQRCTKADQPCVFTTRIRTRQRNRTDIRVAELEREVRAMRQRLLESTRNQGSRDEPKRPVNHKSGDDPDDWQIPGLQDCPSMLPSQNEANKNAATPPAMENITPSSSEVSTDVITRGIVAYETAMELCRSYSNDLIQHYPAVALDPLCNFDELRRKKPTLFLAVLTAAAGKVAPKLARVLHKETLKIFAEDVFLGGEKSLELVEALTITVLWCFPLDDYEKLNFYQYIHLAATMALDLGIAEDRSTSLDPKEDIEGRRTLLSCYLLCSR